MTAPGFVDWLLGTTVVLAAAAYLRAAASLRRRGDTWPRRRDVAFAAGGFAFLAALLVPVPGGPFTAHMAQHVVLAMAAPLLLVLGRPVTLMLRVAPSSVRRGVLAVAHSRAAVVLLFPPLAAVLDVGGLWLLYRTSLASATHHDEWLRSAVQLHVVLAGLLFTFVVCQLDPVRRRWNVVWRGLTLLGAGAAHAILAKTLYAWPPPGTNFTAADVQGGAQIMYYGGDLVELALAAALARQWYVRSGRARRFASRGFG